MCAWAGEPGQEGGCCNKDWYIRSPPVSRSSVLPPTPSLHFSCSPPEPGYATFKSPCVLILTSMQSYSPDSTRLGSPLECHAPPHLIPRHRRPRRRQRHSAILVHFLYPSPNREIYQSPYAQAGAIIRRFPRCQRRRSRTKSIAWRL